jgi:subtilisin family serine protease
MSLGGDGNAARDVAVTISMGAGITYTVAAGNDNQNACLDSPARDPDAITVGSVPDTAGSIGRCRVSPASPLATVGTSQCA